LRRFGLKETRMRKFLRWVLWSAVMGLGGWVVLKLLRTTAQDEAVSLPAARAAVEDVKNTVKNVAEDATEEVSNVTSTTSNSKPSKKSSGEERINLNEASQDELADLNGVGPVLAERIVAARPFQAVTDLTKVSGIGKAKLEELKGSVTL